jgi:uncharacterized membrane protein
VSPLIQALHAIAATAWVGGIFFAYMALRPAVVTALDAPLRPRLWLAVYGRFFPWVWVAIGTLLLTGYADLFIRFGGFGNDALYLKAMHGIGLLMIALFAYLYFGLYRALGRALAADNLPAAGATMMRMRPVMAINLGLGMLQVAIGVAGPYL